MKMGREKGVESRALGVLAGLTVRQEESTGRLGRSGQRGGKRARVEVSQRQGGRLSQRRGVPCLFLPR